MPVRVCLRACVFIYLYVCVCVCVCVCPRVLVYVGTVRAACARACACGNAILPGLYKQRVSRALERNCSLRLAKYCQPENCFLAVLALALFSSHEHLLTRLLFLALYLSTAVNRNSTSQKFLISVTSPYV